MLLSSCSCAKSVSDCATLQEACVREAHPLPLAPWQSHGFNAAQEFGIHFFKRLSFWPMSMPLER